MEYQLALLVRPQHVKSVKTDLEGCKLLSKHRKIQDVYRDPQMGCRLKLVTTLLKFAGVRSASEMHEYIKRKVGVNLAERIEDFEYIQLDQEAVDARNKTKSRQSRLNPVQAAIITAVRKLPEDFEVVTGLSKEALTLECPASYNLHGPLLLLPALLETHPLWKVFLSSAKTQTYLQSFFGTIAGQLNVTHIAVIRPVLAQNPDKTENVIRSPSRMMQLYGDFGPTLPPFPQHMPSNKDFVDAFWAETRQHGILQTWSPNYTMFCHGNVTEKGRILTMPSIAQANSMGPWTAVDLFAGVGYFAFSYAVGGAAKVLCWDINLWSVEGLRRGATLNDFTVRVLRSENERATVTPGQEIFTVFHETNELAPARISSFRKAIPPVMHVNCGMLPSSKMAWKTAVRVIDPGLGGWVHVHESVLESQISDRVAEVQQVMQDELAELNKPQHMVARALRRIGCVEAAFELENLLAVLMVTVESVVTVKSMAPRLNHYVIDLRIPCLPDPMFRQGRLCNSHDHDDNFQQRLAEAIKLEIKVDVERNIRQQEQHLEDASAQEVESYLATL